MRISWLKIKRIRIKNTDPNIIDMPYDYEDNSWSQLSISQRGRRRLEVPDPKYIVLKQLRNEYIPVDEDKLKDLDVLCTKKILFQVYIIHFSKICTINLLPLNVFFFNSELLSSIPLILVDFGFIDPFSKVNLRFIFRKINR